MNALWCGPSASAGRQPNACGASTGAARVLVIDDNVMNQEILVTILRYAGYEVAVADDGRAGFEAVRDGAYDIVLMDLAMPVMGGLESAGLIRQLAGRAGRIPIVAFTAGAMGADAENCRRVGMNDFLVKPSGIRQVLQVVAHWTGGSAAAE